MEKRGPPPPVRPPSGAQSRPGSASPVASPRAKKQPMRTAADELLFAQPASVHFGGFALDQTLQQRVRVHNNSAKAVRLRYVFPSGRSGFRAAFASAERPPFVSAGLSEELLVSFSPPAGFQYYYDCIQVRCEEVAYASNAAVARRGAALIPLHAYPTVNEVAFPPRLDFGVVPRGACARRELALSCSVPVAFDFELRLAAAHPAFTVFPMRGVIPARGQTRLELEFRPLQHATASAELQLHVSQLGFQVRSCQLVGSSSSTEDAAAEAPSHETRAQREAATPASPPGPAKSPPSRPSAGRTRPKTPRSGDTDKHKRRKAPHDSDARPEELETVRGVELPRELNSVTGVSFVLNQEPGKLQPQHLQQAIAAKRALRRQQRDEQAQLRTRGGRHESAPGELSFRVLVREEARFLQRVRADRQVQELFFQQELDDVAQSHKALEVQSHRTHLGQRLLSQQQLAHLAALRELNAVALARARRETLRAGFSDVAYESPGDEPQPQQLLLGQVATAALPARFAPAYEPDFKPYKNDLWARRQRVLRRLVRAVATCVLRLRAQKRLDRLRAWLAGATTRAQVRDKVARDWQRHGQAASREEGPSSGPDASDARQWRTRTRPEDPPRLDTSAYLSSFPVVQDKSTPRRREAIAQPPDGELQFHGLAFLALKPRDEALLMGHEPLPLPPLPTHVALEEARGLRLGASGECGVATSLLLPAAATGRRPTGSDPRAGHVADVATPSLLELLPADVFLRPQASVRPLVAAQTPRETDASDALRPRRVFRSARTHFAAWQRSQLGLQSVCARPSGPGLALSDVFVAQTDRRRAEPLLARDPRSGSDGLGLALLEDAWHVGTGSMPARAEHAEDVPSLSDSESDEDEQVAAAASAPVNWQRAVSLFEAPSDEKGADTEAQGQEQEQEATIDDGGDYEPGERLGRARGLHSFPRYRHLIRQERSYNAHRHELLQRLPQRLEEVAAQIQHPDQTLVVEGHGPERPLHQPRTAAA